MLVKLHEPTLMNDGKSGMQRASLVTRKMGS